jgi:hypothetical protein
MNWTYAPNSMIPNSVVYRVNPDGSVESYLVTVPMIQEWIEAGNTPEPSS